MVQRNLAGTPRPDGAMFMRSSRPRDRLGAVRSARSLWLLLDRRCYSRATLLLCPSRLWRCDYNAAIRPGGAALRGSEKNRTFSPTSILTKTTSGRSRADQKDGAPGGGSIGGSGSDRGVEIRLQRFDLGHGRHEQAEANKNSAKNENMVEFLAECGAAVTFAFPFAWAGAWVRRWEFTIGCTRWWIALLFISASADVFADRAAHVV